MFLATEIVRKSNLSEVSIVFFELFVLESEYYYNIIKQKPFNDMFLLQRPLISDMFSVLLDHCLHCV